MISEGVDYRDDCAPARSRKGAAGPGAKTRGRKGGGRPAAKSIRDSQGCEAFLRRSSPQRPMALGVQVNAIRGVGLGSVRGVQEARAHLPRGHLIIVGQTRVLFQGALAELVPRPGVRQALPQPRGATIRISGGAPLDPYPPLSGSSFCSVIPIALPTIPCASRRIFSRRAVSLNLEIALLFLRFCSLPCTEISRRFGAIFNWQSNKSRIPAA